MGIARNSTFILALYTTILTGACAKWVYSRGGLSYVAEQLHIKDVHQQQNKHQLDRLSQFKIFPPMTGGIVFIGDSITELSPWQEYFEDAHNRGLAGETSAGIRDNLDAIVRGQPNIAVVAIGTNDLFVDRDPADIHMDIKLIVTRLRVEKKIPKVFVVSILPNSRAYNDGSLAVRKAINIRKMNNILSANASSDGYVYIDANSIMADSSGDLKSDYTIDGTHLTAIGIDHYARYLKKAIAQ